LSEPIPYDFSQLPKVSRQETELLSALQSYLPRIGFAEGLKGGIQSLLRQHLGPAFSFELESVRTISADAIGTFLSELPSSGIYLQIGLVPVESKAFCEVDPLMAHVMIDHLLGGAGEPLTMIRPLSEIEQGIFSFLVLKVLSLIYEKCGASARVHFRLEVVRSMVSELVPPKGSAVALTFRLILEDRSGYLRIVLPSPMVQKGFLEPFAGAGTSDEEREGLLARLESLGFVETDLWAEVGRTILKAKELQKLERGDVVLLDQSTVILKGGQISGRTALRLGKGAHGALRAKIVGSNPFQVEIEGVEAEHPVTPPSRKGKK